MLLLSALLGLVLVLGCGASAEEQKVSEILKLYGEAVGEYETADDTKRNQLKEKINSYRQEWSSMISALNDKVTPQVMHDFEREFKEISKKYASLNS
jgi:hypothetical protein